MFPPRYPVHAPLLRAKFIFVKIDAQIEHRRLQLAVAGHLLQITRRCTEAWACVA